MKNKLSDLNNHLFEAIEMLKNNSDPNASENEKMDLETAKRIADLGKVIVEGAKVQVQALELISKSDNQTAALSVLNKMCIIETLETKSIGE